MKFKKLLSLAAAAAISAGCFVGMTVTASAASAASNKTLTADIGTVYTAEQLYGGDLKAISSWTLKNTFSEITPSKSFGTTSDDFTREYKKYVSSKKDVNTTLNVTVGEAGTYLLEMLCEEYNTRYPKVTVNDNPVFSGAPKSNATDATHCVNYDKLSGGGENCRIGTFNNGSNAAIVVLKFKLKSGLNVINLTNPTDGIRGLMAVVLNKAEEVPATGITIYAKDINTANLILKPEGTIQLTGKVQPDNATTEVEWSSSNDEVATVSNGMVTAVAPGTATITAKAGDCRATSEIEVLDSSAPATTTKHVYARINCTNENVGGNTCNVNTIHKFANGADEEAKAIFADEKYGTVIDDSFLEHYVNTIVGTSSDKTYTKPSFRLTIPRGTFKMYLLGRNSGTDKLTAAINGTTIGKFTRNVNFAAGSDAANSDGTGNKNLDLYVLEFTTEVALTNAVVTFNTDQNWLPDMYAVAVAGTEYVAAPATGSTYTGNSGNAAASFKTDPVEISGTITNPKWIVKGTKDGNAVTGTIDITRENTKELTLTDANVTFGILITDITDNANLTDAELVYTVE